MLDKGALMRLILIITIMLSGCASIQQSSQDMFSSFNGKYIASPQAKEQFASLRIKATSNKPLFFDGHNKLAGTITDFNKVYCLSLQTYLNQTVDKLLNAYPGEKPKVQVIISDNRAFSPSSTPYNELVIPLGMLVNATTDDEIAALLAHELSHILLNHFSREEERIKREDLLSSFINIRVEVEQPAQKTQMVSQAAQDVVHQTRVTYNLINTLSDTLWGASWQRAQEQQADYLAADLMVASGYSVKGFRNALKRLDDYQGKQKDIHDLLVKQQNDFLIILAEMVVNGAKNALFNPNQLVAGIEQSGVKLVLNAAFKTGSYVKDKLDRTHDEPAERLAENRAYWEREYKKQKGSALNQEKLVAVLSSPDSVAAIRGNELAFSALQSMNENNLAQAENLLKMAILSDPISPGPRYINALLRKRQNNLPMALYELESIQHWEGASLSAHREIILDLIATKQYPKAIIYLAKTEDRGWIEDFYVEKIDALRRSNTNSAQQAAGVVYNQCLANKHTESKCWNTFGTYMHQFN